MQCNGRQMETFSARFPMKFRLHAYLSAQSHWRCFSSAHTSTYLHQNKHQVASSSGELLNHEGETQDLALRVHAITVGQSLLFAVTKSLYSFAESTMVTLVSPNPDRARVQQCSSGL